MGKTITTGDLLRLCAAAAQDDDASTAAWQESTEALFPVSPKGLAALVRCAEMLEQLLCARREGEGADWETWEDANEAISDLGYADIEVGP